eukprot:tig00001067_g6788.t1
MQARACSIAASTLRAVRAVPAAGAGRVGLACRAAASASTHATASATAQAAARSLVAFAPSPLGQRPSSLGACVPARAFASTASKSGPPVVVYEFRREALLRAFQTLAAFQSFVGCTVAAYLLHSDPTASNIFLGCIIVVFCSFPLAAVSYGVKRLVTQVRCVGPGREHGSYEVEVSTARFPLGSSSRRYDSADLMTDAEPGQFVDAVGRDPKYGRQEAAIQCPGVGFNVWLSTKYGAVHEPKLLEEILGLIAPPPPKPAVKPARDL